jgi:hypothetical protein
MVLAVSWRMMRKAKAENSARQGMIWGGVR